MSILEIIALLKIERDKLDLAIAALGATPSKAPTIATAAPPKKRHISAASRRKMALAQKKRWAALKAAK